MSEEEKGIDDFTRGFTAACAILQQLQVGYNSDMSGDYAEKVLRCNVNKIEDLIRDGVDENDIKILMPVIKELERKRKQQKP